ncbi:MAG TPA: hypothetical protein VFE36_05520 [Candidatus Baltobacteraceae bacterium]|nr:hypothetical protein [Candidatus Baltobacteraceae bacterium]
MTMATAAATLTGLVFVVITLVRDAPSLQPKEEGIATFTTPIVIHFCTALYIAAVFIVPWRTYGGVAVLVGLCGIYGVIYVSRVILRTLRLNSDGNNYTPDMEDWIWYNCVPLLAYLAILGGSIALPHAALQALFAIAGGVLLLLFTGIRNAWDVVTYLAITRLKD